MVVNRCIQTCKEAEMILGAVHTPTALSMADGVLAAEIAVSVSCLQYFRMES